MQCLQPFERSVHLGKRDEAVTTLVEHQEGVVQQQPARVDRLAHAHRLRALLEHRPLVLEHEELRERRLLPPLGKAAAARDHDREEEAPAGRWGGDRAQEHVDLGGPKVHCRVDETEAVVRDRRLVRRCGRVVWRGIEDGIVRPAA